MSYEWDFGSIWVFVPDLVRGLGVSFSLLCWSIVPGYVAAAVLFAARRSRYAALSLAARCLTELLRALPVLALMVWLFYVLPSAFADMRPSPFVAAVLALGANYAALQAENLRTGAEAIPLVELEIARSMGISPRHVFLQIVLPQATWRSLPAAMNQAINTFKLTSLAAFISVHELFFSSGDAIQGSQRPLETYTVMAAMYLIAVFAGTALASIAARRVRARFGYSHG